MGWNPFKETKKFIDDPWDYTKEKVEGFVDDPFGYTKDVFSDVFGLGGGDDGGGGGSSLQAPKREDVIQQVLSEQLDALKRRSGLGGGGSEFANAPLNVDNIFGL